MSRYTGNVCPVCQNDFADDDDIVVCHICGSPHHRDCYKSNNGCGNEQYHYEGKQWQSAKIDMDERRQLRCSNCGSQSEKGATICSACGTQLGIETGSFSQNKYYSDPNHVSAHQPPPNQPTNQPHPDSFYSYIQSRLDMNVVLDNGVTLGEACMYVGSNSISFALRFVDFTRGKLLSVNWCALLFSYFYCFYRKMYKEGLIALAISLLVYLPIPMFSVVMINEMLASGVSLPMIYSSSPTEMMEALNSFSNAIASVDSGVGYQGIMIMTWISNFVNSAIRIYFALFFNRIYFKKVISRVGRYKTTSRYTPGTREFAQDLGRMGSVNPISIIILIGSMMFAYFVYTIICTLFLQIP